MAAWPQNSALCLLAGTTCMQDAPAEAERQQSRAERRRHTCTWCLTSQTLIASAPTSPCDNASCLPLCRVSSHTGAVNTWSEPEAHLSCSSPAFRHLSPSHNNNKRNAHPSTAAANLVFERGCPCNGPIDLGEEGLQVLLGALEHLRERLQDRSTFPLSLHPSFVSKVAGQPPAGSTPGSYAGPCPKFCL